MHLYHQKSRALEPKQFYCMLTKRIVSVLVEYPDYKHRNVKGDIGSIYCEHIVQCYHAHLACKYSGISPSYPDPLVPPEYAQMQQMPGSGGATPGQTEY